MRLEKDWAPSFSYHATVLSFRDADSASTSPSPSTSIAKTDRAPSAAFVMTRSVKDWEPSFSYHATAALGLRFAHSGCARVHLRGAQNHEHGG